MEEEKQSFPVALGGVLGAGIIEGGNGGAAFVLTCPGPAFGPRRGGVEVRGSGGGGGAFTLWVAAGVAKRVTLPAGDELDVVGVGIVAAASAYVARLASQILPLAIGGGLVSAAPVPSWP